MVNKLSGTWLDLKLVGFFFFSGLKRGN
jgi:hypothetical protein